MTVAGSATGVLPRDRVSGPRDHAGLMELLAYAGLEPPEAMLHPADTGEVAAVMRWASETGVGVLPLASGARLRFRRERGAGRWVVLATDRLSGVELYEAADLTITAGAGTPMSDIDAALRANRQWAPFDPPHVLERSLGGVVADAASGPLWTGYGELRNHVLGATVVTGDGRVLRLGGRVVKNVAGFDLLKPMTGSRGSLAVMTSVTLRAFPVPAVDQVLAVRAPTVRDLLPLARLTATAPVLPVSCVVTDAGEPTLLVRLHGAPSTVAADRATIETHAGVSFDDVPEEGAEAVLARVRDHATGSGAVVEASARPSRLPELLAAAEALAPAEIAIDAYGGSMRLGLTSLTDEAVRTFTRNVEALGGAVGVVRAPPGAVSGGSATSVDEAALVDRLREAFDPEGVLWPAR